jgi:hypothetical protein
MPNFDASYERLCLSGYAGGPEFEGWWTYPRPNLERSLVDEAFPWWRAIVERAADDGLAVRCFIGERPDSGDPPTPAARLMHPWTATSFPDFLCAEAKQAGWVAIARWRELAASAPPELAAPAQATVVADYARLCTQGRAAALYCPPPAAADNSLIKLLIPATGSRLQRWQTDRIRPWFLQLVRLARADGLLIHCQESRTFGGELFATATLLDPATGLAGDDVAEFVHPSSSASRKAELLREAKEHTDSLW